MTNDGPGNGERSGRNGKRSLGQIIRSHVGVVPERPYSPHFHQIESRLEGADVGISVCPYCAVGCSQLVYHKDNTVLSIEGNYESFINGGTLCPKGSATYGLVVNPNRVTTVKYRAPGSDHWDDVSLDWAMERIAQLVKQTRDQTYVHQTPDGATVNRTTGIAHLGGATLDNEENYLIKKLFTAGLGIVYVENQARI
jgi:formate dehydrogenase major subunit